MGDSKQAVRGLLSALGMNGSPPHSGVLAVPKTHMDPSFTPKNLKKIGDPEVVRVKHCEDAAKVLVLYTGGTIGMKAINNVYCPAPNFLVKALRSMPIFHDDEFELDVLEGFESQAPLILPSTKNGTRIVYTVWEYDPLLDSCNMTMTDWARLALDIQRYYDVFDGFVILHGTDTMAYTASALSFIMENLGKPVILTGSQIPIFETRSDGRDNFLGALIIAGHYCIPEVCVYFNNKLMRGNRSTKVDSGNLDAFKSPNLSPLAESEIDIHVNWSIIFRPPGMERFNVHINMSPNVGLLRLFPSITKETVSAFLQPPMGGVIIQTYGAGNGPDSRKDLLKLFSDASARGVLIVNITQCTRGSVSVSYAAGKALFDAGIIPGGDMTPEAALTKLSYVLGKTDSYELRKKMMQSNLRGEMRLLLESKEDPNLHDFPLVEKLKEAMKLSSEDELQMLKNALFPPLLCSSARDADIEELEQLRQSGAIFSQGDYDGRTCLHVAASEGHEAVVKYLLDYGTPVHVRDRYGHTPLDDAVRFNHHNVIKMLVKTGAHLHGQPYVLGTQLCVAATSEIVNMLSWILAGANVNQPDYDGRTALHIAVCHNREDIVKLLMQHGGDPFLEDSFGATPIDEATKLKHFHLLKLLNSSVMLTDILKNNKGTSCLNGDPIKEEIICNGRNGVHDL